MSVTFRSKFSFLLWGLIVIVRRGVLKLHELHSYEIFGFDFAAFQHFRGVYEIVCRLGLLLNSQRLGR